MGLAISPIYLRRKIMSKPRVIRDNSVFDMWRFGWVLLDYDMMVDAWVGRDGGATGWSIPPENFKIAH